MVYCVYVCVSVSLCKQACAWHYTPVKVRGQRGSSLFLPLPEFWDSNSCQGQACSARTFTHGAISLVWEMFYIQWPNCFWYQIEIINSAGSFERVLGVREKNTLGRLTLLVGRMIVKRDKWKAFIVEAFQTSLLYIYLKTYCKRCLHVS